MIPIARRPLPGLVLAALLALPVAVRAQSNVLDLAIGDPARLDDVVEALACHHH